jgi:hypothetical protein
MRGALRRAATLRGGADHLFSNKRGNMRGNVYGRARGASKAPSQQGAIAESDATRERCGKGVLKQTH